MGEPLVCASMGGMSDMRALMSRGRERQFET